jgi:hypothetical protein
MKKLIAIMIISVAGTIVLPMSLSAQTKMSTPTREQTIDDLKATSGDSKLTCTGGAGHMTCTSKYAWVCPKGWKSCTPPPGGTCCTQR